MLVGSPGQRVPLVRHCTDQELLGPPQLQGRQREGLPEAVMVRAHALQPGRPAAPLETPLPPQRFQSRLPNHHPPSPAPPLLALLVVLLWLHVHNKAENQG